MVIQDPVEVAVDVTEEPRVTERQWPELDVKDVVGEGGAALAVDGPSYVRAYRTARWHSKGGIPVARFERSSSYLSS